MHHPGQLADLVHHRHADLHREAAASRRAAAARHDPSLVDGSEPRLAMAPARRRPGARRGRERLGLLLVAWGSRLAPVRDDPC
jgi:hypothetical protein